MVFVAQQVSLLLSQLHQLLQYLGVFSHAAGLVGSLDLLASFRHSAVPGDREKVGILEGDLAFALPVRFKSVHQVLRHTGKFLLCEVQASVLLVQVGAVFCLQLRNFCLDSLNLKFNNNNIEYHLYQLQTRTYCLISRLFV